MSAVDVRLFRCNLKFKNTTMVELGWKSFLLYTRKSDADRRKVFKKIRV